MNPRVWNGMKLPDNMKIENFDIGLKAFRAKEISVALNKSPNLDSERLDLWSNSVLVPIMKLNI